MRDTGWGITGLYSNHPFLAALQQKSHFVQFIAEDLVLHCSSAVLGMILLISSISETMCGLAGMLKEDKDNGRGMHSHRELPKNFATVKEERVASTVQWLIISDIESSKVLQQFFKAIS